MHVVLSALLGLHESSCREAWYKKRKTDSSTPIPKKNCLEKCLERRTESTKGKDGLEYTLVSKFLGHCFLPLKQLHISPNVASSVSSLKVWSLKVTMKESFDPSLCALTVSPMDEPDSQVEDFQNRNFIVLHGIQR